MNSAASKTSIEFIAGMAMLMSLVALSIDTILPALSLIGEDLGVDAAHSNDNQLLLSTVFFGMGMGLLLYGPLSDSFGRKPVIFLGISISICGAVISLCTVTFEMMLVGRLLQGFGAASCRVVSVAMIRDKLEGAKMAKVMSQILVVFVFVPAIAPLIGQVVLSTAGWRAIFLVLILTSGLSLLWLYLRQPETLPLKARREFSTRSIAGAAMETLRTPVSIAYMLAAGLTFGGFVGYLSLAQPIFQGLYELGDAFALVFAGLALSIGAASYINSRLLKYLKMEHLCICSLALLSMSSLSFYLFFVQSTSRPELSFSLAYLSLVLFSLGILMGNFNALALQPLGHIAGTASSVISSIQTLIAVVIGGAIGRLYSGSIAPLVVGFAMTALCALIIVVYINYLYSPPVTLKKSVSS